MLILDENVIWHLEAFASELFIYIYISGVKISALTWEIHFFRLTR